MRSGTIAQVLNHYFAPINRSLYGKELDRASKEFFGEEGKVPDSLSETGYFSEWFIFDFKMENGKTPLEHFWQDNPVELTKEEREEYRVMGTNFYSAFEITRIDYGKGFTLTDLVTDTPYEVREKSMTRDVAPKNTVFCRLMKVGAHDEHWEIAGGSTLYTAMPAQEMRKHLEELGKPIDPRKMYAIMKDQEAEEEAVGEERPDIASLNLEHAGIEMKRHPGGRIELIGSYEGPTEESYDGCSVCVVIRRAQENGDKMPDPETLRDAIEEMAWDEFEKKENKQ